jgi:putative transposase
MARGAATGLRAPPGEQGPAQQPLPRRTTHLVMSPLELMRRLAALVPRPRLHLIRFDGVLPPNAKPRSHLTLQRFTLTRPIPRRRCG